MKRSAELLSCLAAVLFHVALTGWFFCLAVINFDFTAMGLNFIWLCLAGMAGYLLNALLLSRGVPAPVFALVQLLLVAGGAFLYTRCAALEPYVLRTVVITCAIYCTTFPMTAYLAYEGPGKNGMLLRFDLLVVMMAVLLLLEHFLVMPAMGSTLIMCGLALAFTVVALVAERAGRWTGSGGPVQGNALAGRLLLAGVFLVVALVTAAIAVLAGGGVRSFSQLCAELLSRCAAGIKSALLWLYGLVERFFSWLAQFAGDMEFAAVGMEEQTVQGGDFRMSDAELSLPGWVPWALAALGAALLAVVLFRLRRGRAERGGRRTVRRYRRQTRRESHLKGAFAALLRTLGAKLRYRFNCLRLRRTAPGLLAWCERKAGKDLARRTGESGEQFLLRLAGGEDRGEEEGRPLRELAALVERSFYSPHPAPVSRELYAAVKKLKFTS